MIRYIFILCLLLPLIACKGGVHVSTSRGHRTCTVTARGDEQNDVPNILTAFKKCSKKSAIIFPIGEEYWIGEKLHARLEDVDIHWHGKWLFSPNTTYWRNNSFLVEFQNHRAGFILSGDKIHLNGYNTGGIDGNGDLWYDEDKGRSTEGRPMPFVLWNITNSKIHNFKVQQSQFWSLNIMNGTNLAFENITCASFSNNAPAGKNWVQNTDGFNTMDARNISLNNFLYRGGDDCIAIKPRSYDIRINNITCDGGNGVAIGSLGQYLEDSSVENVTIVNAEMKRYSWDIRWSVYIKTWIGELAYQGDGDYEGGGLPRGGGWGKVRNLLFENFHLKDVSRGPFITQENGRQGGPKGTSKMEISDVIFRNFTGNLLTSSGKLGEISCSVEFPCSNIHFEDMDGLEAAPGVCQWTKPGSIFGLPGCSD
ncbi:unnamed protein product [Clonostachys rosea]|uniref:galacturonan 1,4-alpha-galacturonidase n=1 Tax=Bionectria ochroleuca TaxID=29856 RepID=A0ABY6UJ83_BIOOC|nr:unnamed protein product [Clonostachys rosea]